MAHPDGPLAGVVVVDLTRQLAGPQSTRVLADLGAKVLDLLSPLLFLLSVIIFDYYSFR